MGVMIAPVDGSGSWPAWIAFVENFMLLRSHNTSDGPLLLDCGLQNLVTPDDRVLHQIIFYHPVMD